MCSLDSWNLRLLAGFLTISLFSFHAYGGSGDATVTGTVTEAGSGVAIAGATVAVGQVFQSATFGSTRLIATTTTDPSGGYQIVVPVSGPEEQGIVVEAAGPEHAPARFNGEPHDRFFIDSGTDGAFTVISGQLVEGVDFALEPGATVSGSITNAETGSALPDAFVEFQDGGFTTITFTSHFNGVADASGNYQSALALPAGEYVLRAVPQTGDNFVIQAWDGVSCELRSCNVFTLETVDLQGGQSATGFDFALKPGAAISGTFNPADIPFRGVSIFDLAGAFVGTKSLAQDSDTWSFDGLEGGSYYIQFEGRAANNYVRALHNGLLCPFRGCSSRAIGPAITVSAGSTRADVDIELQQGGQVSGTLVAGDGNPVPFESGSNYDVIDADGNVVGSGVITEENGEVVLRPSSRGIPPGDYFVRTFSDWIGTGVGYDHFGQAGTAPGFADGMYPDVSCAGRDCDLNQATPVTITAGEITDIVLEISPGSDITGSVVDDDTGEGIGSALVKLVDVDNNLLATVQANADGDFSFGGFPAGSYYLRTSMAGRAGGRYSAGAQTPYFDTVHGSGAECSESLCNPADGVEIVLDGSANAGPLELRLTTGPVIRGQILEVSTGESLSRGEVVVFDENDNFVGIYGVSNEIFQTTALMPGTYTLTPQVSPAVSALGVDAPDGTQIFSARLQTSGTGSSAGDFTVVMGEEDVEVTARVADTFLDIIFKSDFSG